MPDESKKSDAAAAEATAKLELLKELNLPTAVLGVDLSDAKDDPKNQRAFAACFDGGVYAVDLDSGKHQLLGKHESYASGVKYLRKTGQIITTGYDGTLRWHDVSTEKPIRTIQAHRFWSWQMDVSPNEQSIASVTGQYLAGGYKYEPAPEQEPSVRVYMPRPVNSAGLFRTSRRCFQSHLARTITFSPRRT